MIRLSDNRMKSGDISYNFSVAKVLAILMVATAHYFGGLLWIPTTIALFVFAFSSGYFSSLKYRGDFSVGKFWKAKLVRLGYGLAVADVFLLLLFLIQGRSGIWTWETPLGMVGLNEILPWLGMKHRTPFGYGLWFLTVLWLFYLAYPAIERINRNPARASAFILIMLVLTTYLNFAVHIEHVDYAIWMTVFAFLFGSYAATIKERLPWIWASGMLVACITAMLALNKLWDIHSLNYYLIILSAVAACDILLVRRLPGFLAPLSIVLSGCVMEIYLIHEYLFIRPQHSALFGYALSMLLIVLAAKFLSIVRDRLKSAVDRRLA